MTTAPLVSRLEKEMHAYEQGSGPYLKQKDETRIFSIGGRGGEVNWNYSKATLENLRDTGGMHMVGFPCIKIPTSTGL